MLKVHKQTENRQIESKYLIHNTKTSINALATSARKHHHNEYGSVEQSNKYSLSKRPLKNIKQYA